MQTNLFNGNCKEVLKSIPDNSIDSIVTDPPYELGFMGKSWDASGIAYDVEMWGECLRVLKPGGHLLSFGGSRTYHRMACAIEDAGFEIRDQIMWVYGSGFPKSHNISKAIDKTAGAKRTVIGYSKGVGVSSDDNKHGGINRGAVGIKQFSVDVPVTAPATDEAKQWDGWGTALKPAHEPIVMARKLLDGTVANNVLNHGVGGINIDGCRVISDDWDKKTVLGKYTGNNLNNDSVTNNFGVKEIKSTNTESTLIGRFPANFIHDGSDEVSQLFPFDKPDQSAARFFYCAKANKKDRNEGTSNNHPTVKPTELMRYLCRLVTPPNGTVLDPFTGSGSTGKAAALEGFNFVGIEQSAEYIEIALARIKSVLK
jgi:DNA modification methylase